MSEAYDLRSNIKGKAGSQGTLFQVKDKGLLNPQQRWPKGYTPERLGEVREATRTLPITPPEHLEESHEPGDYKEIFGYRERAVRTIAKSTVPAEHLAGLNEIHGEPDEGDHGTYWMRSKKIGVDLTEQGTDRTLIHELGHHYENDGSTSVGSLRALKTVTEVAEKHAWQDKGKYQERPNRTGQVQAEGKVQAGVHEALADNYMVEHYRTGGRKSKPVTEGQYERNFDAAGRESRYPGYNDVRPPKHLGPQFHQGELF